MSARPIARDVNDMLLNPHCLSWTTSDDVASDVCLALAGGAHAAGEEGAGRGRAPSTRSLHLRLSTLRLEHFFTPLLPRNYKSVEYCLLDDERL
jgi:hypothetical protein